MANFLCATHSGNSKHAVHMEGSSAQHARHTTPMLPAFHGVAHDLCTSLALQVLVLITWMGRGFGFSPLCFHGYGHSFRHDLLWTLVLTFPLFKSGCWSTQTFDRFRLLLGHCHGISLRYLWLRSVDCMVVLFLSTWTGNQPCACAMSCINQSFNLKWGSASVLVPWTALNEAQSLDSMLFCACFAYYLDDLSSRCRCSLNKLSWHHSYQLHTLML